MIRSSTAGSAVHAPVRRLHWDIFCRVVDNFGDVGVAWRLARQLAAEYPLAVRLFVDDLKALARVAPGIDIRRETQRSSNIDVVAWAGTHASWKSSPTDDTVAVVEAFGCGLPDDYLSAMVRSKRPPVWINLEYLSAEPWIEGCHGLASRHPRLPLQRYFYFPGFVAGSGGLLRERGLLAQRDMFQRDAAGVQQFLWRTLGVAAPPHDALIVSLFCYPHPALPSLFDAWATGDRPVVCLVPESVADRALDAFAAGGAYRQQSALVRGQLTLHRIPFTAQDDYDRLLWTCDLNFVRGEDSFVRSQWAARPMIWQAYPQADAAHVAKVSAFLMRYCRGMSLAAATAFDAFVLDWNADPSDPQRVAGAWPALIQTLPALAAHALAWATQLSAARDLAEGLVKFVEDRV
jgi:uncharacterized repeat protein (TIGR03837 family)